MPQTADESIAFTIYFDIMLVTSVPPRHQNQGRERVRMHAYLVAAAYNLVRIAKLSPVQA